MAYNVLIVDDSPAMRRLIGRVLDSSDLDFGNYREAGNGQQALDILRRECVDLVLTDLNMPAMDGEQFVRSLGRDESLRSIPVIVVSTDCTEGRVRQLLALGASGYVTKPFRPEALCQELERVLSVCHSGAEAL